MNRYGARAQEHWRRFLPRRYGQIEDPSSFFSILGEEVASEIDALSQDLAGADLPAEEYLTKVGRLTAARQQAEEQVLRERVLLPAEPGSPEDEETEPAGPPDQRWAPTVEDSSDPTWQQLTSGEDPTT